MFQYDYSQDIGHIKCSFPRKVMSKRGMSDVHAKFSSGFDIFNFILCILGSYAPIAKKWPLWCCTHGILDATPVS
jgi:hypothetical protein